MAPTICLIFILYAFNLANGALEVPEALDDGVKGNPGTQTCIRQKFLPILRDIFGHLVDTEFGKVNPPDTTVKLPSANQGSVTISNMKFASFASSKKHSLKFLPPNETEWVSTGLNYSINGQFKSNLQQLFSSTQTSGSIFMAAKNASLKIRTRIWATKEGRQRLEMTSCKPSFGNVSVSTQASGFFGALSKFFQEVIASSATRLLEQITCNTARYYIETILNDMFANGVATSVPVSDPKDIGELFPSKLIYNFGLLRDPKVYKNCLGMQEVGEVSWENKSGTPFHPVRLNYSTKLASDHMMDIWVSDYAFNSMLYHANVHHVLDFLLDGTQTPQLSQNLQSQCANDASASISSGLVDCIGHALPELANEREFPQQTIQIQLKPSNATVSPFIIIRGDPASLMADFVLDVFALDTNSKRKNVLTADVHLECGITKLKLESASILKAEATKTSTTLQISQEKFSLSPAQKVSRTTAMASFTAILLEKMINTKLSSGIPLPHFKGIKFVKADVVFLNRTMNIATDVEMDQGFWTNAASQARLRVQGKN